MSGSSRHRVHLVAAAGLVMAAAIAAFLGAPRLALLLAGLVGGGALVEALERRRTDALCRLAEAVAGGAVPVLPPGGDAELARLAAALDRLVRAAADDRQRLREVASRAFRAQEGERLRIASELQEQTAQTLAGLLIRLRVARGTADETLRERVLEELRAGLAAATDSVRRYARGLYPPALEDLGVVAAIQAYAMALHEGTALEISVAADDVRGLLARDGELALYRVVQEALGNAARHGHARRIVVHVDRHGTGVRASVEDDGAGFDLPAREAAHPCLGLLGMRERAMFAGGRAEVSSAPGAGTRVVVEIPGIDRRAPQLPPIVASASTGRR